VEDRHDCRGKKILIVDDEEDLREIISFEFELIGFDIAVAENGRKGFEAFQREKPDVVLSDIRMPGGDGLELLKRIKSENPFYPPVLLMTGFADLSDEDTYLLGADFIFAKPFDSADLLHGVTNALIPFHERMNQSSNITPATKLDINLSTFQNSIDERLFAIGRNGIFIHTQQVQKVGTPIEVLLTFEEGDIREIGAKGIVRWSRVGQKGTYKQGMGIELTGLNTESMSIIQKYIETHRPLASIPCG
jgi:DNA-binding response OmpR family regulator